MIAKFREILSNVLDDYYDVEKYKINIITFHNGIKKKYIIKVEEINGVEKYVIKGIYGTKLTSRNYTLDEIFNLPVKEVLAFIIVKENNKKLFTEKVDVKTKFKIIPQAPETRKIKGKEWYLSYKTLEGVSLEEAEIIQLGQRTVGLKSRKFKIGKKYFIYVEP